MPEQLSPQALLQQIEAPDLRIVQITDQAVYARTHIPGAVLVTPAELVDGSPPATGRLPSIDRLQALFAKLGHHAGLRYVVCDDEGGGWAGRMAWTLDMIGHHAWTYLDGGLHAWAHAGLEFSDAPVSVTPTAPEIVLDNRYVVEAEDIVANLSNKNFVVWDCRSVEEHVGEKVVAARGGHIPGAKHLDWLDLMDRDRGLALKVDAEALMAEHGITADKDIVTHCQTHHRSGLTYMAARLLGFANIRAYHGSWSEWGNRDDLPIETGHSK